MIITYGANKSLSPDIGAYFEIDFPSKTGFMTINHRYGYFIWNRGFDLVMLAKITENISFFEKYIL